MLEQAGHAASKALDLRTTLKMQSVVLALARVVFAAPEFYDLALLQRHGRVLWQSQTGSQRNRSKVLPASGLGNQNQQDDAEEKQR